MMILIQKISKELFNNNDINVDLIKEIISEIPFYYVGNKKSMINNILNILKQIGRPIDKFVDLFSGSMVLSYIIRYINKDIKITCYENNPYLINFYKYISNDLEDFLKNLKKEINIIINCQDKNLYIKGILKNIDTISDKEMGMWYFILINISHCNIISYKIQGISSVTFNSKELDRLMKLINNGNLYKKLKKYSDFIKTIEINDIDITRNYYKIIKEINHNTFLYIDSPYYNSNSNKLYYSNFNVNDNLELNKFVNIISKNNILFMLSNSDTVFIENLYNNFNINKFSVKFNINCKDRKEFLITNFIYNKV
jgi:DNA adenine methylase